MSIKLTQVDIGPNKYFATFTRPEGGEVTVQILASNYDNIYVSNDPAIQEILETYNWEHSAIKISFDTVSGSLSDKEYATQTNGYHWVKIPGYKMYKVKPEYVDSNGKLTSEGEAYIVARSEAE